MEHMSPAQYQAWQQRSATKYRNKRVEMAGEKYHSGMEAADGLSLNDLLKHGEISDLERQVRFKLYCNGYHITDALVDFRFKMPDGTRVWYETKGMVTQRFQILKKLIVAQLPEKELYIINWPDLARYLQCYRSKKPFEQPRY